MKTLLINFFTTNLYKFLESYLNMEETYFKRVMTVFIVAILLVLTFFLLKPLLLSIAAGLILAFVFIPSYRKLTEIVKSKNFAAAIISFILILAILLPIWFFTPTAVEQSFRFYQAAQQIDFVSFLKSIFPSFFASEQFSSEVGSIMKSFLSKTTNLLQNSLTDIISKFPQIFLHFAVVFFTFFYAMRDNEKITEYVRSFLPFPKQIEDKLFNSSKGITIAVIYGQIIIGILQGLLVGIGFLIFRVPNTLLLTLLACLAGVFPVLGTTIVWLPVIIYLVVAGNTFAAIGILIFGLVSTSIDNLLRPLFVSRRTNLPSSVILIGMIGGLFMFGILGIIIGPLIIAYLLIILELYRQHNKNAPTITTNFEKVC